MKTHRTLSATLAAVVIGGITLPAGAQPVPELFRLEHPHPKPDPRDPFRFGGGVGAAKITTLEVRNRAGSTGFYGRMLNRASTQSVGPVFEVLDVNAIGDFFYPKTAGLCCSIAAAIRQRMISRALLSRL